nr:hypothetical protein [Bacillus velezensis]
MLGIIGYFIFKKVWTMVVVVLILSLIFMFVVIGAEPTLGVYHDGSLPYLRFNH